MSIELRPGVVNELKSSGAVQHALTLRVTDLQEANGKLKCNFSDSKENIPGVMTSQVARQFGADLKSNDLVKITEGNVNSINEKQVLIVAGMELLERDNQVGDKQLQTPANKAGNDIEDNKDMEGQKEDAAMSDDAKTPAAAIKTAARTGNSYTEDGRDSFGLQSGPTPPSGSANHGGRSKLPPASKARNVIPISGLNPYFHGWSIRAKVVNKTPKRSFSGRGGAASSVFTAELVDEEGGTIEGTFWRDSADKYYDALEVGHVYVFSRGSVKPANKKYSQTRNDYCVHFDSACEVEAAEVSDTMAAAMVARMDFIAIDQLAAFVDKKAPVDLIGVVTSVGQVGSVKRKTDQTELSRRDITMVDRSCKTVTVTLWGDNAEKAGSELEKLLDAGGLEGAPILAVSTCRVSSYNGVSVSALSRSQILINPEDMKEAQGLRSWWKLEGIEASNGFTAVGEGLVSSTKKGDAGARPRTDIASVRNEAPQSPDEKPVYSAVSAAIASINPEQSMWYLACPENNRKVVEQNGQYFCEWDGKTYPTATHRYILLARVADASGELAVQIFNDQAELLLGRSADDMAALKASDPAQFNALLTDAAWTEWVLRVKAQAQEYNGDIRKRYAIADIKPIDYNVEARRTLDLIAQQS